MEEYEFESYEDNNIDLFLSEFREFNQKFRANHFHNGKNEVVHDYFKIYKEAQSKKELADSLNNIANKLDNISTAIRLR